MWQRLKDAVDSRIAEESARQAEAARLRQHSSGIGTPPSRQGTPRPRATSRNNTASGSGALEASPSGRRRRGDTAGERERVGGRSPALLPSTTAGKGPDPAEFEPEFVIGDGEDEDGSTRVGTPAPGSVQEGRGDLEGTRNGDGPKDEQGKQDEEEASERKHDNDGEVGDSAKGDGEGDKIELPANVTQRLKKLERLEPKYSELLRSYRLAHARISAIEPFEATLRENTPLTSINDAGAFAEYLLQINNKSSMIMDELKRVTAEKDYLKRKMDDFERRNQDTQRELETLQKEKTQAVPIETVKSPALESESSTKAAPEEKGEDSEDFFSYESELPRLQDELKENEAKIAQLQDENKVLKSNLASARESAEQLVKNLESSAEEISAIKTSKVHLERELNQEKARHAAEIEGLESRLHSLEADCESLRNKKEESSKTVNNLEERLARATAEIKVLKEATTSNGASQGKIFEEDIESLNIKIEELRSVSPQVERQYESLNNLLQTIRGQLQDKTTQESDQQVGGIQNSTSKSSDAPSIEPGHPGAGKKKNKKKKKGGKGVPTSEARDTADNQSSQTLPPESSHSEASASSLELIQKELDALRQLLAGRDINIEILKSSLSGLRESRDTKIANLQSKIKDQESLQEDIESLRDDLINVGQELVEAKDNIKELGAEKAALQEGAERLEKEIAELKTHHEAKSTSQEAHDSLAADFQSLKQRSTTLETDLVAAQKLAASRFKALTDLREAVAQSQPEVTSLRAEVAELRKLKDELASKAAEVRKLEARERDLKNEITRTKKQLSDKDADLRSLNDQLGASNRDRRDVEDSVRKLQRDYQRLENEKREALEGKERISSELSAAKVELTSSRSSIQKLENEVSKLRAEAQSLADEINLKTAQYASAQSLMNSLQDQSSELGAQVREARGRAESLEEEVADAQRLLGERSREAETMRRLLSEADSRAEERARELREKLDWAVAERDRAEEDMGILGKKRARELEALRGRLREVEKREREGREGREEIEKKLEVAEKRVRELEEEREERVRELEEVKLAIGQMRDELDDTERQAREVEKERGELKKQVEELTGKLEKVTRSSKVMQEELKSLQNRPRPGIDNMTAGTSMQSSRSSIESSRSASRLASPPPRNKFSPALSAGGQQQNQSSMDFVYLKTVLLQFLQQKDKKHQQQLVPVLGMLLHFDRQDEQKWMSAISERA